MAAAVLDTPTKRRSLPPLNTSEAETASPKKTKKKKKNGEGVDASDSQLSNVSKLRGTVSESTEVRGHTTTASTEDIANVGNGSKRKKKKRKPPDAPDGNAEEGDISGQAPAIENLKASPGAARRKREGRKSHIPRSVSDEIATESNGNAKQKAKRPRSKFIPDDSADGEEESAKTPQNRPPTGKAKTKKKKAKPLTSGDENYHADGEDLLFSADDVVTGEVQVETARQPPASQVAVLPSQPVNKLFMERKGGFASEDKKRLIKRRDRERRLQQEAPEEIKFTTTQCALSTHRKFLTFTLLCHGVLAGYSLWQCVVVFVLASELQGSGKDGQTQFLEQYSRLAQPASSVYYFLLALCTVSVFDRFDIARPDRQFFRGLLTFQSGAISILVYLISLIFSTSIAAIDDRISLFLKSDPPYCEPNCPEDGSLWDDDEATSRLNIWRIINLIRAIGAILGWTIIAITPTTDYTSDHLHDADVPLWEEQQDTELGNVTSQA
ncbi:transmembrane protein 237-like isoform X1 [Lytechinus variegatus]|uniref:transmembrane protein 237-like isoform X1 n=1 Tax=Lytechinus variegatus TaxID=7654 RepID=UPI001BB0F6E8|nr:transmembrane protein 237-like isoform X1 [Lytechinus variegatus]